VNLRAVLFNKLKHCSLFKADIIDEPDKWLQSQLLVLQFCFDAVKTEEKLLKGSALQSPCPKKRRKHYEYRKLDAWKSVFGIYILDNPNIQIPTHPDAIKFRKRILKGLYLICDGGYHKWRVMQCPNKHTSEESAVLFSQRLESVRKDAECTFRILKKRWHILKNHMLIQDKAQIDNLVFTCAILHNMLLEHDTWGDEDDAYDIAGYCS
jgi:hypothetical protein